MPIEAWLAFVIASSILLVIPGPTILAVISYSVTHGNRANLPLAAAVALGDATALAASIIGLGALLALSAFWFTVVKVAGGLYMIYLGFNLLRSSPARDSGTEPGYPESRWKLFVNAYIITALNPKSIIFFIAFLPQFTTPDGDTTYQLWLLAVTFVVLATANTLLYTLFSSTARNFLSSMQARRRFNQAGGTLLSVAGVWTLLAKRPPL